MSAADVHESFIKTPQQLIVVVLLSFVVPIIGIILIVQFVLAKPTATPSALAPEAVAARIQPVGKVEFGAADAVAGARSGEDLVKSSCGVCHTAGVANAPKIGDKAKWAPLVARGLGSLVAGATTGKGAMPARGGVADATELELSRAIVFMANQSGGSLKEPAAPKSAAAKSADKVK